MADKGKIRLLITITERGSGKGLARLYADQGISCCFQCMGHGTASSELLDVLGIGTAEKDILICIASKETAAGLFGRLEETLQEHSCGKGLVFDIPVTGLNSLIAAVLLGEQRKEDENREMEAKMGHSLILVAVNQGHTDTVMDTAREAGARGGTVIRARWAGPEDTNQFYGISIQPEKEIIAIVASGEQRNTIMEMINKKHGLKTQAGAVVCSVGIEHSLRLT